MHALIGVSGNNRILFEVGVVLLGIPVGNGRDAVGEVLPLEWVAGVVGHDDLGRALQAVGRGHILPEPVSSLKE